LRQQALLRNKLFDLARQKLNPTEYTALSENQNRWIKSYTSACGVAVDDPIPSIPISQSVIECYRKSSHARTEYLTSLLGASTPATTPPSSIIPAPALPDADWRPAMDSWYKCLYDAVNALSNQPEPAQTVADAAFGSCTKIEADFRDAAHADWAFIEKLKSETVRKQVIAQVMALREARSRLQNQTSPPETNKAIDYNRS
jgi:hypothetical protein